MSSEINLTLILAAALLAAGSPGPATLGIAGTSMAHGRRAGLAMAAGVTTGSLCWSALAAFGLSAVMLAHAWLFELARYLGAGYLIFLAWKSARRAMTRGEQAVPAPPSGRRAFRRGLALHLTNPKAVLFFGSLYSLGVPADAPASDLLWVIAAIALQNTLLFHGYALLFSSGRMIRCYLRLRRGFEAAFAAAFAAAGIKILTSRGP
ncbi:LysE family translocator [Orrella sp. JC864]|uniref:LysE family translocator n=1 Tax=Orrella sp. JC864 TaxID=3120298 RepID=UPI0012BC4FCA